MRLHTDTLTRADILAAVKRAGLTAGNLTVSEHGSRSRARAFNVYLTGTSSRMTNSASGEYAHAGHAATRDEWGMFLAELYRRDAHMIAGSPGRPVYADTEHFRWTTGSRFDTLTAPYQHGAAGHRWQYVGTSASGNYGRSECTTCDAATRTASISNYRAFVASDEATA